MSGPLSVNDLEAAFAAVEPHLDHECTAHCDDFGIDESGWWTRFVRKIPFLTKECFFGNRHWRWERLCACGLGEVIESEGNPHEFEWHGGLYDFKHGTELQLCNSCAPDSGILTHQWRLSLEEEVIIAAWRTYRRETLDLYQENYQYRIGVELNEGESENLVTRIAGIPKLDETIGTWFARPPKGREPN